VVVILILWLCSATGRCISKPEWRFNTNLDESRSEQEYHDQPRSANNTSKKKSGEEYLGSGSAKAAV
jgi:hypothetical protein